MTQNEKTAAAYAAIDLGATSGRIMLYSTRNGLREVHRFPTPMLRTEEGVFWDFPTLRDSVLEGLKKLSARANRIVSISCDSWAQDFGMLDADGKLLKNPFSYRDTSCEIHTRPRLEFISRKYPELRARAAHILHIADLVHYVLCGAIRPNYSLIAISRLEETHPLFAKIADCEVIGEVNHPELKELWGVPVVSGAGHDTAAAYCGGAPGPNDALISLGTWYMAASPWSKGVEEIPQGFGPLPLPGRVLARTFGGMGMWPVQQCVRIWRERGTFPGYKRLDAESEASAMQGMVDPEDKSLFSPDNMEKAVLALIGHDATPAEMSLLLTRGLAKNIAQTIRNFGQEFDRVILVGGASGSPFIQRLLTEALQRPLTIGDSEASAMGNILIQQRVMEGK